MRVMMLLGSLEAGGAETTAFRLAEALHARGDDISVLALRSRGEMGRAYQRAGIPLCAGVLRWRFDALAAVRIARILRAEKIDVVLMIDALRNLMYLGDWAVRLSGRAVRCVLWSNSVPTGQMGDFSGRLGRFVRCGRIERVVCTSQVQRGIFTDAGIPAGAIEVIYNGLDLRTYAEASPAALPCDTPDGPVVIQVANVMPDKDFETLLAAASKLLARGMTFVLLLVGRGTDSPQMQRRIDELGLGDVVRPLGSRSDVPQLLAEADVFVLSTHSEVFNVATLEAMAAGLPIVVSDLPAFDEMFTSGAEGLKVPPGDADALAEAVESLLSNDERSAGLAAAARQRVERFSIEKMCEQFEDVLKLK